MIPAVKNTAMEEGCVQRNCFATGEIEEPRWTELSLPEIFKIAFKSNPLIKSHDHPAMKLLRGE